MVMLLPAEVGEPVVRPLNLAPCNLPWYSSFSRSYPSKQLRCRHLSQTFTGAECVIFRGRTGACTAEVSSIAAILHPELGQLVVQPPYLVATHPLLEQMEGLIFSEEFFNTVEIKVLHSIICIVFYVWYSMQFKMEI